MIESTLIDLRELRQDLRRITLFATGSVAGAVVLLPLAYRGGAIDHALVIVLTVMYLVLVAFRFISGFQVDRQIELESRFIGFAGTQPTTLMAVERAGQLWRYSCLVQGIRRGFERPVPDADVERTFRRTLRRTSGLLLPSAARLATVLLIAIGAAWIWTALTHPSSRSLWLYGVVVPVMIALSVLEFLNDQARRSMRGRLHVFLDAVAACVQLEWDSFRSQSGLRPFRHRLMYRDAIRAG